MNYKYFTSDGCKYEGMTQDTITTLRIGLGKSTTFITETEYNQYTAEHRPI